MYRLPRGPVQGPPRRGEGCGRRGAAFNTLDRTQFRTVDEVALVPDTGLIELRDMGPGSLQQLREVIPTRDDTRTSPSPPGVIEDGEREPRPRRHHQAHGWVQCTRYGTCSPPSTPHSTVCSIGTHRAIRAAQIRSAGWERKQRDHPDTASLSRSVSRPSTASAPSPASGNCWVRAPP